ncbi:hypothetical protein PFISCL1PPCAC_16542, partial [Pristionchus fissidentatus]
TIFMPVIDPNINYGTSKSKKIFIPPNSRMKEILLETSTMRADYFQTGNLNPVDVFRRREAFGSHFIAQCQTVLEHTEILRKF